MTPIYLMYQADSPKQTLADLATLAHAAYLRRFGVAAPRCLVAASHPDPLPPGAERATNVQPTVVWVGGAE